MACYQKPCHIKRGKGVW